MKGTLTRILQGSLAFWVVLATGVQAAPGTLSSTPLIVTTAVDPNLMLLLDNSGSMNNIVPEAPYDANFTYVTCPAAQTLSTGTAADPDEVEVRVEKGGDVYFEHDGDKYDWGLTAGKGKTGEDMACFDSNATYKAKLEADEGDKPSGYLGADYAGNYLNWYFSNSTRTSSDNFGIGGSRKKGTTTRMEGARAAATTLVKGMDNVRLGLATYNGSNGAHIREGLDDVANNRASVISTISTVTGDGSTPLAESFEGIGRYFVEGFENQYITLHPNTNPTSQQAKDVFDYEPKYSNSSDEPTSSKPAIEAFCQQNFLLALTDGRPQSDQGVSKYLQDYDGDCTGASPACGQYDQKKGGGYGYETSGSDYIDDVAQALYEIDLRPDLDDYDGNEVVNNVITYMVGFADDQVINDPLMKDAAKQGGGLFVTAKDADSLVTVLKQATADIFSQVGSAASVAFNSTSLGTDSAVFFARFNTNRWNGELFAYPLNGTGNVQPQAWEASQRLDGITPANRVVFTHDGSDGVNFQWSKLSLTQKADLSINKNGVADTNGQARLEYLRGERSNEGTGIDLRIRNSRLGDIVDSTPVYVGAPGLNYPDAAPFGVSGSYYSDFVASSAGSRKPVVYVGANDGMVHGFDGKLSGTGGDEVLAYVPSELYSANPKEGLHYLASTDYEHRFYVNASPTVSDVFIDSTGGGSAAWRTVLIGGTGAGGQGIFALDVTDPGKFAEDAAGKNADDVVLWEFTSADDADLGATLSKPIVAMMNNGKWAVIFGNGYSDSGAGDGKAKLFILYIEEGIDGTWGASDYIEIDTGVGGNLLSADRNGLSSVTVADLDGDRIPDRIYGGDLFGNMWVFDVSDKSASKWGVAYSSGKTPKPLFTATDGAGTPQPITAAPALVRNASDDDQAPDIIVLFGTGQYLTAPDITNTAKQSFYGIWDHGSKELGRSDLVSRTLSEASNLRKISGSAVDWKNKHGWYVDFDVAAHPGERVISNALVRGGILFFNTIIPSSTLCASGGDGFLMSLNPQSGLAADDGVFDADNDGDIDSDDAVYVGERVLGLPAQSGILGNRQYTPTSKGVLEEREIKTGAAGDRLGRLAWEELILN